MRNACLSLSLSLLKLDDFAEVCDYFVHLVKLKLDFLDFENESFWKNCVWVSRELGILNYIVVKGSLSVELHQIFERVHIK